MTRPSPGCGVSLCKDEPGPYPHGDYCVRHARMMAPRSQWTELGVPYPDGQEPALAPAPPQLTRPVRTRLGWPPVVDPAEVVYAPCPAGCGRPAAALPRQEIPPCLSCEAVPEAAPEPELEAAI